MRRRIDTYLVQLTVEELIEILKDKFPILTSDPAKLQPRPLENPDPEKTEGPTFSGRVLYGIKGIEDYFHVAHKTAWQWKDTWLAPAIKQRGKKIMVDLDYALILFSRKKAKKTNKH